ncbi:Protein SUPPRESSOR OF GENE SILENCING 3 [Bienertia sinuspersici]
MREGSAAVDSSSRRDSLLLNNQGLPIRDNATASKFQWKNLLKESGNHMFDDEERGFQGNYGRKYDGLVEKVMPGKGEMISNSPTYAYDVGIAGYRERSRNMTVGSVEDPNCRGCVRNMTDFSAEDAGYYRRTRNMTGSPIRHVGYNGYARKLTSFPVEDAEYHGRSRTMLNNLSVEDAEYHGYLRTKMNNLPVEDAKYHRRSRTMMNVSPVEDAGYQTHTRSLTGVLVEDARRTYVREHPRHMDRELSMKSYEEDNCYRFRNEDSSRRLTPRSQSNGQHTSIQGISFANSEVPQREVFHYPADELGIRGSISPSNCYNSHGIVYSNSGSNARNVANEIGTCQRADYHPNMSRHVEYTHPESQRSGKVCSRDLSEDSYDKYDNEHDYYDHGDPFGNNTLDPALPRHGFVSNSRKFALQTYGCTLQEEPIIDVDDISRGGHCKMEYGVNMHPMDIYLENEIEASHETRLHEDQFCYEIDAHDVSPEDDTWTYPASEEGALTVREDAQKRLQSGENYFHDQPKKMPKKRKSIEKTNLPKLRTSTLGGRGALSYDNRHLAAEPKNELIHLNRSLSRRYDSKANTRMAKTEPRLPFGGLSKELQSRLSKPLESGVNNVKNRLNPRVFSRPYAPQSSKHFVGNDNCARSSLNVNRATSAPQPSGKARHTSVKKRLKAAPDMDVCLPDPQVSHPGLTLESQQKLDSKNSSTTKEASVLQETDADHSIFKVKPTEKDPPDNSNELKLQVDQWFSKCMLYLNASPGRLKKYKEQGKAHPLKCIICSSSKEFIQAKDVATHAFTSLKVGLRAPHLGFHRAICTLMGWDPDISSNGRWICKSLPDVEARALKEDLILWPPIVVIHNGSAGDFYNNELVKISVEQLENSLRDMGLSEGKATICHGKPGNPNIMLVKFNGTLSGLLEAQRLDKVFFEKKRGRADLQEVDAGVECIERVVQEADLQEVDAGVECTERVIQEAENKIENTLYGYLGVVEDLDKLNYELKRRCVGKSKKEILASIDTAT